MMHMSLLSNNKKWIVAIVYTRDRNSKLEEPEIVTGSRFKRMWEGNSALGRRDMSYMKVLQYNEGLIYDMLLTMHLFTCAFHINYKNIHLMISAEQKWRVRLKQVKMAFRVIAKTLLKIFLRSWKKLILLNYLCFIVKRI